MPRKSIVRELAGKASGDNARRLIALALDDGDLRIATSSIRELAIRVGGRAKKTAHRATPQQQADVDQRTQRRAAMLSDPSYIRACLILIRDNKLVDIGQHRIESSAEAIEHVDGEPRRVEAEVVAALPAPKVEQVCFCGHGLERHPGGGPCEANGCAFKGIRACGMFSSIDEAAEVRALRKRDPFSS